MNTTYQLDLNRYEIIRQTTQPNRKDVILMKEKEPGDRPWCAQYGGNGHYFETELEMLTYCERRRFRLN